MPEKVLGECQTYTGIDGKPVPLVEDDRVRVLQHSRRMAASGLRVLALSYGRSLDNLVFAGLVAMEDPPRHGVQECVQQLRQGGVKVMMVTGDSKETALAIAHKCGILGKVGLDDLLVDGAPISNSTEDVEVGSSEALSGDQLDAIPLESLADSIAGVKVFYRVVPRHKLAIVRALQSRGDIVAMTGDGVNDATALKGADIGVAMGKNGTDVAKEAADVVLADDDFRTITMAIAEGKGIFFNIRCFLAFQLSTSFAALTMASVATLFGLPSPLNAMQILWINIIMDGPPAQSLGVEPVDEKILTAKPRKADDPIVTQALLLRAVTSAALIVVVTLGVFAHELSDDGKVSRRDTTMTFMTFVNCDLFNAYVCRSAERCFYELNLMGNPAFLWAVGGSIVGQLLVIYWAPLQEVFQTEALPPGDMLNIILLSASVLVLDTMRKKLCHHVFNDGYHTSPRAARTGGMHRSSSWLDFARRSKAQQAPRSSIWGTGKVKKAQSALAL
jgi:Ca2+-transporting ATPase